ncbi:MAG: hypothetical protein WAM28_06570 [Chlamydiales bacterium]
MLEKLFGNRVVEKILFYVLINQKGYATQMKKKINEAPVRKRPRRTGKPFKRVGCL